MELAKPFCDPFREMLAHPKTIPHLNTILGEGWRLDHDHQRRAILYKYNAGHMSWGGGGLTETPAYWNELTEPQQAALLLPCHHSRRPKASNGYRGLAEIKSSA